MEGRDVGGGGRERGILIVKERERVTICRCVQRGKKNDQKPNERK